MGAGEDVDAVDLVQAEPVDHRPREMGAGHAGGTRDAETLRGERDPARGLQGRECRSRAP